MADDEKKSTMEKMAKYQAGVKGESTAKYVEDGPFKMKYNKSAFPFFGSEGKTKVIVRGDKDKSRTRARTKAKGGSAIDMDAIY